MSIDPRAGESAIFLDRPDIHSQWESDYLNPDMDRFYDAAFADIIRRVPIRSSDHVLDAGCGYCFHTRRLARSGAKITAVDYSHAALEAARDTLGKAGLTDQVTLRQGDLTALQFPDATFDHVVCWGVLMHIPELEKALAELARVLKPQGMLVICENNMRSPDIAVRERAIMFVKKLLRRSTPQVTRTPRGIEVWHNKENGGLMVRIADMGFLTGFLQTLGFRQTARIAGQLTYAYTNLRLRPLKRAVYALNVFYFKHIKVPSIAVANILFFRRVRM